MTLLKILHVSPFFTAPVNKRLVAKLDLLQGNENWHFSDSTHSTNAYFISTIHRTYLENQFLCDTNKIINDLSEKFIQ